MRTAPPGLRATDNRAFEANIKENHPNYTFYTSEHNDGHEDRFCRNGNYNPEPHPKRPSGDTLISDHQDGNRIRDERMTPSERIRSLKQGSPHVCGPL
jgi:hypothetical protein